MNKKIVFLDAATVDYGDIDTAPLESVGEYTAFATTSTSEIQSRVAGAGVLITNKVRVDESVLAMCDDLRAIAVAATGYNNIDIAAAKRRGVAVANVPAYSTSSVAQCTMACVLACATNLVRYNSAAHDGRWSESPIFTLGTWPFSDVRGKVMGIMGMGAIGKEVARLASAFGMKIVALKRENMAYTDDVERMSLYELAEISDYVSVHMPLTAVTRHLIGDRFFQKMKPSAFLINMARGAIIDSAALNRALRSGRIAGAALDVMEQEPPSSDDPLLSAPNCIITPHVAWASRESRQRLINEIAENIGAFFNGELRNRIDTLDDI